MQTKQSDREKLVTSNVPNFPLLSVQSIGRHVAKHWQWENLTFTLYAGERLAITGPSGCGKSLLLRALAGLDPIHAGKIIFADRAMSDWYMPNYRALVIYLPQRPALMEGTVEENFQAIFKFKIHSQKSYNRDSIIYNLSKLGREAAFLKQPATELSGGESQIVALLRALQLEPQILLLDEPTASLDAATVQKVEVLVQNWMNAQSQRACIWTSHDSQQLVRFCSRQITLKAL